MLMTIYKTSEVASIIGVHPNTVRLYEEWGLISKPERLENGYRIYTDDDIKRLKIIRSLRCANYSLEAILHMLRQLSQNPNTDIRYALNIPKQTDDIISACDRLILSLSKAKKNAKTILDMLYEMSKEIV
jgi:Predicted transcriptional regulators